MSSKTEAELKRVEPAIIPALLQYCEAKLQPHLILDLKSGPIEIASQDIRVQSKPLVISDRKAYSSPWGNGSLSAKVLVKWNKSDVSGDLPPLSM